MQSLENKEFEKVLAKNIATREGRESLVDNEYLSDVILVLANGEQMRAHKIFLATSGLFFYKRFAYHEDDVIRINLEWISKPIMLEVCRFIYSDILNINDANMMDIWSVAKKMHMKYLVEKATDFICRTLNEKNVFKVLETNMNNEDFRLNVKCFEYIQKNYDKCLETEEFLQLSLYLLKTVLQTLKLPNKIAKESVIKWGNYNSHEDIEELLMWMSLNEDSEASEEKPNTSFKFGEVQQLKIENIKKPDDKSNFMVSKILSTTHTDQQYIYHGRNLTRLQMFGLFNHKPNKQLKHFILDGPKIIRQFQESDLVFKILSKDMIVKEIHFIGVLSTDKNIRIMIRQHEIRSEPIIDESIEDVKINGDIFQYIPNKKVLLKANESYAYIYLRFRRNQERQTFDTYKNVSNDNDRIKFNECQSFNHIISRIVYKDAYTKSLISSYPLLYQNNK